MVYGNHNYTCDYGLNRYDCEYGAFQSQIDPAILLNATNAWRADDATEALGQTTSLVPYVGALTLLPDGATQAAKTISANLNSQLVVPFTSAAPGYAGALSVAGNMSYAIIARATVANPNAGGFHSHTIGTVVNSGNSSFEYAGDFYARKMTLGMATTPASLPINFVLIAIFTPTEIQLYQSAYTPVNVLDAQAITGDTFRIGALDNSATYAFNGEWAWTAVFNYALSASNAAVILNWASSRYGIAIAP